jgi:hypothetical protein
VGKQSSSGLLRSDVGRQRKPCSSDFGWIRKPYHTSIPVRPIGHALAIQDPTMDEEDRQFTQASPSDHFISLSEYCTLAQKQVGPLSPPSHQSVEAEK